MSKTGRPAMGVGDVRSASPLRMIGSRPAGAGGAGVVSLGSAAIGPLFSQSQRDLLSGRRAEPSQLGALAPVRLAQPESGDAIARARNAMLGFIFSPKWLQTKEGCYSAGTWRMLPPARLRCSV
jgi:hypothetical protein